MARSIKKGPYIERSLQKKVDRLASSTQQEIIRTWSRRSMILPEMIGHTFHVHNGKLFMPVFVSARGFGVSGSPPPIAMAASSIVVIINHPLCLPGIPAGAIRVGS